MITPSDGHVTTAPGSPWTVVAYDTVDSTMDAARRLAKAGAAPSLLVTADQQTAGRGRRGARWIDGGGNLKMTAIFAADCPPARAAELSFVAGLAARDAIRQACPAADVRLKWPNDVLINGAKAAGLLLEAGPSVDGRMAWALIGLGVNIVAAPDAEGPFGPVRTAALATYGATLTAAELALAVAAGLDDWSQTWRSHGFGPILAAWRAAAAGLGGRAQVRVGTERLEGRFVDLDEDGTMLLETAAGLRRVTAGDVALIS